MHSTHYNFLLNIFLVLPPSSPTNVIKMPQATSVFLSWTQSINDVVNNYTVIFTKIEGCASARTKIFNISGQLRNHIFTGLEEDIKYMILISAANIHMSRNASVMVKTATSGKHNFFWYIIFLCT